MADVLGVHESLLSLYRSGQRLPSLSGCLQIEKSFPGFLLRLVQGYYRHVRQRDMAARGFEDHDGRELEGPPAQRVGPHMMDELLLV